MQIYLNVLQPLFQKGQHIWEFIVRVHIVNSAAALLQQANNVLILNLFMHLELLEGGAQWLKKWPEVFVVWEVGVWQLKKRMKMSWSVFFQISNIHLSKSCVLLFSYTFFQHNVSSYATLHFQWWYSSSIAYGSISYVRNHLLMSFNKIIKAKVT